MKEIDRVVVIEDDPDARALARACLEGEGWDVLTAADAAEGLELVRSELPDLVLVDYLLPGTDGLEVCRRLTAGARTAAVSMILLTGREDLDPRAVRAAGAAGVIAKPFRPAQLGARIRELLA